MPRRNPPNRSGEYRKRADKARSNANETTDDCARNALLKVADTWERLATYEDRHNVARPSSERTVPLDHSGIARSRSCLGVREAAWGKIAAARKILKPGSHFRNCTATRFASARSPAPTPLAMYAAKD